MKIGIIGAGNIGRRLAEMAVKAGHEVMLSNSRGPETLSGLAEQIGCKVGTAGDAAQYGDVVVATIPLKNYRGLPAEFLTGKIVIDTMNYYPQRDGAFPALDNLETTTSEIVAGHLPGAKVVKCYNAILAKHLEEDGRPGGAAGRRALPIAGDDGQAKSVVASLNDEFGFDTVDGGPLSESWRFERAKPAYCIRLTAEELKSALAEARRDFNLPEGSWHR